MFKKNHEEEVQYIFVLFRFNFFSFQTKSQNITLKLNANDCANCSQLIDYLVKNYNGNTFQYECVLRAVFQKDSASLANKFSIQKLKNVKMKFSDSLYEKYDNTAESELYLMTKNQSILYHSGFRQVYFSLVRLIIKSELNQFDEILLKIDKKIIEKKPYIFYSTDSKLSLSLENEDYIYDIFKNKLTPIKISEEERIKCYQFLSKGDYQKQLNLIEKAVELGANGLGIGIIYFMMQNDSIAECVLDVPMIYEEGEVYAIRGKLLLGEYHLLKEKMITFKTFPKVFNNDYEYTLSGNLFKYKDFNYYILSKRNEDYTGTNYFIAKAKYGEEVAIIDSSFLFPSNYIQYKLYHNFN